MPPPPHPTILYRSHTGINVYAHCPLRLPKKVSRKLFVNHIGSSTSHQKSRKSCCGRPQEAYCPQYNLSKHNESWTGGCTIQSWRGYHWVRPVLTRDQTWLGYPSLPEGTSDQWKYYGTEVGYPHWWTK